VFKKLQTITLVAMFTFAANPAASQVAALSIDRDAAQTGSGIAEIAAVIEGLRLSSDFSMFLGAGVPIRLHRQAMFKLWRLDPQFGSLDGLNDYDEDFRDPAMIMALEAEGFRLTVDEETVGALMVDITLREEVLIPDQ
jgi:hypothetical protein